MSRIRSSSLGGQASCSYVLQTMQGVHGDPRRVTNNSTYNTYYYPQLETWSMTDEVTPRWRRRKANGDVVNNPMSMTKITTTDPVLTLDYEASTKYACGQNDGEYLFSGSKIDAGSIPMSYYVGSNWLTPGTIDINHLKDIAITNAWAKAETSEILAGETIAEFGETVRSVTSILKRLYRISKAVRKGNIRGLRKEFTLKELSNRWMEGRYAIRPLCYDIAGVFSAFKADKKPRRVTFRSGQTDSATTNWSGVLVQNSSYKITGAMSAVYNVKVSSGVLAAIDAVSDVSIWGLNQPFETIWELVPFSFVVDWFFNVGKTIAAWTPNEGIRALASWTVVSETLVQTISIANAVSTASGLSGNNFYSLSTGTRSRIVKTTTRIVNPNLPIVPSVKVRLDAAKLLDLAIMGKRFFFHNGV